MTWDQIQGQWKQLRGDALVEWGKLSGDEFDQIKGDRDKLIGLIQKKYAVGKEEAEQQVEGFASQADKLSKRALHAVVEKAEKIEDKAMETAKYVEETNMKEMMCDLRDVISKHPTQSVFLGIGLGYLVGRGFTNHHGLHH